MYPRRQSILGAVGDAALRSPLPNHVLINPKVEVTESILEGSFYEIDHSKLLPGTPATLRSVRAVMVTAKSELNVTVRYPSTRSLAAYFGNSDHIALRSELYPALDEKFMMMPKLAVEVLKREIPSRQFEEFRNSMSFWLIKSSRTEQQFPLPVTQRDSGAKHGPCFSKLLGSELKGWGLKKVVAYVPNTEESDDPGKQMNITSAEGKESVKEEVCCETKVQETIQYSRKRKRGRPPHSQSKKRKQIIKQEGIEFKAKIKGNIDKQYVDRWPSKRYEAAAAELVEVLKNNGADNSNPISRFQLRREARKRIGDTGLLDHLLKHLAGKVVPRDGIDRLRRRCDTEGKMEYWIESADLVNIRKEAGVADPYWVPPPGWKLGDSIRIPNCMCRQELKKLKEQLSIMRRQMSELKTKDEIEQPVTLVMPDSAVSSWKRGDSNLNAKETYEVLMKKKFLMETQLLQLSKALVELEYCMQEDMKSQSEKAEAAENEQLMPSVSKSLPIAEMTEDLAEPAAEEVNESRDVEEEKESRSKRLIVKLKPCRRLDNNDTSMSQNVEYVVQDNVALASASGSPLSTTTS
ncbi:protein DYAD isoform X2 [Beta vulgaris subsp. vulgaris]|uniref:protein DYAD isoform X2 n=1 Tax=Beta vulgaris subsp. vulgaris TaxID=3555 RepID=UPI000540150E|nr:protein DYAD isoform X2 [Beta vulgaris subsp. vulgaris]